MMFEYLSKKQRHERLKKNRDMVGDRLSLSIEGKCLSDASVAQARRAKNKQVTRKHEDVTGRVTMRAFHPCRFHGIDYLADVITGTLYYAGTGRCVTGNQMHLLPRSSRRQAQPRIQTGLNPYEYNTGIEPSNSVWSNERRRRQEAIARNTRAI